jgi:hypothetical protein
MENFEHELVCQLARVNRAQIKRRLKDESGRLELTKSLLNLLYNIVKVGSVPVSETQKRFFDRNATLVLKLLNKSTSLKWKKQQLQRNAALVLNIAASCPTVAGSS